MAQAESRKDVFAEHRPICASAGIRNERFFFQLISRIGYGKDARPAKHEILVGKNKWVSKAEWRKAIQTRKDGTATKEQKEMLDNGHWKPKR